MTKAAAARKISKLLVMADSTRNDNAAQASEAQNIADTLLLKYEIAPEELPSLAEKSTRPSTLKMKLDALHTHVLKLKMWTLLRGRDEEIAMALAQVQVQVEALQALPRARRNRWDNKRSTARTSTLGHQREMDRRYL